MGTKCAGVPAIAVPHKTMSATKVRSPEEAGGSGPAAAYLASEPHYLSVAGRILAELQSGQSLISVAGDPPADPQLLYQALRKLAGSRHRVIGIACGSELTAEGLFRAGSAVATLPTGAGTSTAARADAPLFVIDEADQLSERQLEEICATLRGGAGQKAAGVLLGSQGFLARLEKAPPQSAPGILTTRLRFDEIGDDEGIDFLRHQLATRHAEDEPARIRPLLLRGFVVALALAAIGIGASATLRHFRTPNAKAPAEGSAPPFGGAMPQIGAPHPTVPAAPPVPTPPRTGSEKSAEVPGSPAPPPLDSEQLAPPSAPETAAGSRGGAEQQPARGSVRPPPDARVSPAEVGALVNRGDAFLSAGDIASARLFYERAADAGDAAAALRLGATFDPNFLNRAGVRGSPGDPGRAASWYRRARDLGDAAAAERLKTLEQKPR